MPGRTVTRSLQQAQRFPPRCRREVVPRHRRAGASFPIRGLSIHTRLDPFQTWYSCRRGKPGPKSVVSCRTRRQPNCVQELRDTVRSVRPHQGWCPLRWLPSKPYRYSIRPGFCPQRHRANVVCPFARATVVVTSPLCRVRRWLGKTDWKGVSAASTACVDHPLWYQGGSPQPDPKIC